MSQTPGSKRPGEESKPGPGGKVVTGDVSLKVITDAFTGPPPTPMANQFGDGDPERPAIEPWLCVECRAPQGDMPGLVVQSAPPALMEFMVCRACAIAMTNRWILGGGR